MTVPKLAGHRGIGNPWTVTLGIPEESIPAIQWAAAHHADIVEGDVQNSGDGVMYMMHDATLDRTTNGTGPTIRRSWSYIKNLWLEIPIDTNGNGDPDNTKHHPPSFRQWLEAASQTGKDVFCELKAGTNWQAGEVRQYWAEVKRQNMTHRVITAASEADITTLKSVGAERFSWGVNPEDKTSASKIRSVVGHDGYITMRLTDAEKYPGYVHNLNEAGVNILLWTLTKPEHYERAAAFNVYGWFCNNVEDAHNWLVENAA